MPPAPRTGQSGGAATPKKTVRLDDIQAPALRATQIPVNPTDPIIIINGQVITRQQLADECVARKGKEIAELMINRTLVEQALRAKKLEVTAAEIDQEINTVAGRFGVGRENWLRTLDKERGISPMQYARDIIYPAIALRKLCAGRVQVTPKDMQQAFEAQYSEKIRCRMILVDTQHKATAIWEELREEPRRLREDCHGTIDGHRQPFARRPDRRSDHAPRLPANAYRRGVPATGRRRSRLTKTRATSRRMVVSPARSRSAKWSGSSFAANRSTRRSKGVSLKDEKVRKQTYEMIYEVKLKETMGAIMQELIRAAAIENQLTGTVKLANEEKDPEYGVDGDVKLMSNPPATKGAAQARYGLEARCREARSLRRRSDCRRKRSVSSSESRVDRSRARPRQATAQRVAQPLAPN